MTATTTVPPYVREIGLGSVGPDVTAIKRALIREGDGVGIVVTDTFGAAAESDLKAFQKKHKLTPDGLYGPATHKALSPFFDAYGIYLLEQEEALLYRNPYRDVLGLEFAGYDQGADFSGSGKVYALCEAVVCVATQASGWPGGGAVAYQLLTGKAAGKTIYLAENITVLVKVGQRVTSATPIAVMHNAYPYTESGWAQHDSDNPMSQPIAHVPTYFGVNFGELLNSLGEAKAPLRAGQSGTPLPDGWPTWTPSV